MPARTATHPILTPREWMLAALLAAAFAPALLALAATWLREDYLSHGFLVPVVALWALLREQPRRARLPVRPDLRGAGVLALSLALYLAGLASSVVSLQGLALVIAVAGGVLYTRGATWLRALAFPVGFLVFMVPPPPSWIGPLILELQFFVSWVAVAVVRTLGLAVVREGNVLTLPSGDALFVAEACSGVTSVITLTPLAVLLAYFTLRGTGRRLLLVLSVVPLAMAGNLVRVVGTVLASERWGTQTVVEGPLHALLGFAVYAVACGLMLALGALLRRGERT